MDGSAPSSTTSAGGPRFSSPNSVRSSPSRYACRYIPSTKSSGQQTPLRDVNGETTAIPGKHGLALKPHTSITWQQSQTCGRVRRGFSSCMRPHSAESRYGAHYAKFCCLGHGTHLHGVRGGVAAHVEQRAAAVGVAWVAP
jgi:hypothetical protein